MSAVMHAAAQRLTSSRARSAWRMAMALTWLACASAAFAQQAVPVPAAAERAAQDAAQPAAADPQADAHPPQRGIPALAASSAANAGRAPAAASTHADAMGSEAIAPAVFPIVPGGTRGVLFKVTPPAVPPLPAELAQGAAAPPVAQATGDSYLMGTIHFGTPREQGLDYAALERALAEVETFVNEADLDQPWQPGFDGYRWLPPQQPLAAMVGEDAFERATALLPRIEPHDLQRMKPWSVLALLEARGERSGEATLDARLQRMAQASGKRLVHLESLEQQLQALDCVPAGEHALVLRERLLASWVLRIESAEAMAHYRGRNLDAWLANIDRMDGLGELARATEQRARRCLLEERNARWIGQLETLFQDGPCFVAVGAIHLVGQDGLIAALRRNGYRVEAMPL
jgi:uncharacterized protein YbaP (TraB family)